ncbi:hypothetical protein, partial [Thiolapillus sp.]|uniref:hypothetical protein n=1 Tax=Thiolapillus sp. TaxID=2017437 RepID=UPI003AF5169F
SPARLVTCAPGHLRAWSPARLVTCAPGHLRACTGHPVTQSPGHPVTQSPSHPESQPCALAYCARTCIWQHSATASCV